MPGPGRTVYIAGAGIAGLTLALGLAKFGNRVVVLERRSAIQEQGAGLQISPNAARVLDHLGLSSQIAERAFEPSGIDVYTGNSGRPLVTLPLGEPVRQRFGAPYAVMHRADLADILFRACRRFANIDIAFGIAGFSVAADSRGLAIAAEDVAGQQHGGRAFAFAGADGVNSHTRTALLDGPAATWTRHVAWRTTLAASALGDLITPDRTSLVLSPGCHVVCYPLPRHNAVNVVLITREKTLPATGEETPGNPDLHTATLHNRLVGAIAAAGRDTWTWWPLSSVETSTWHRGAIGLLGDAAHAMLPFQAQGAAMAIEDAAVLAPLLMTEPDAETAFARFFQLRRERVARVARVSRSNGFAFHLGWPWSLGRNTVLALGGRRHMRGLDWLYGYDAVSGSATAPDRR